MLFWLVLTQIALAATALILNLTYNAQLSQLKTSIVLRDGKVKSSMPDISLQTDQAVNAVGLVSGILTMYFLYTKSLKHTKSMYIPLVFIATAFALYSYQLSILLTNTQFADIRLSNNTNYPNPMGQLNNAALNWYNLDMTSCVFGIVTSGFSFLYFVNRRL